MLDIFSKIFRSATLLLGIFLVWLAVYFGYALLSDPSSDELQAQCMLAIDEGAYASFENSEKLQRCMEDSQKYALLNPFIGIFLFIFFSLIGWLCIRSGIKAFKKE
jgi:hypothetical protein